MFSGEPDSGLHRGRRCLHVALHPRYLGNLPLGLITHFNALVNTYVPELEGILAAYGKITLRSPDGQFFNEEAHIHLDVISEFWTLRPTVGSLLKVT